MYKLAIEQRKRKLVSKLQRKILLGDDNTYVVHQKLNVTLSKDNGVQNEVETANKKLRW